MLMFPLKNIELINQCNALISAIIKLVNIVVILFVKLTFFKNKLKLKH